MSAIGNHGKIVAISGKVIAVAADGTQRFLKVGDIVAVGERLIVPADGNIELQVDNGNIVKIAEARDLTITDDVFGHAGHDSTDAALATPTLPSEAQQILSALQQGQDPLQNLEATAAGLNAAGAEDGGSSYTILDRVSETITTASLDTTTGSDETTTTQASTSTLDAVTENQPSILQEDFNTVEEDTPATGNVLDNDSDADDTLSVVSITVDDSRYDVVAGEDTVVKLETGTLTIGSDGHYTFTPAANWSSDEPITIGYTTNTGSSSTLTINVTSVNDSFTDASEVVSVDEDSTLEGSVLDG
ncbi:retention module-containing protein, partial [Vogesella facilis]